MQVVREEASSFDEAGLDVHRALLELPARQRAAIVLRYFDDLPVAEIAGLLGCGEGSVKTHLARGRSALARKLGREEEHARPR